MLSGGDLTLRIAEAIVLTVLCTVFLTACEAQLDLAGTEAERARTITRSDSFQGAARFGNAAVVVGARGLVLSSTDRGATWQRQNLSYENGSRRPFLVDVTVCEDGTFIALDTNGSLWLATELVAEWRARPISTEEEMLAVTCDPKGSLWVVGGYGTILSSEDFGETWQDHSFSDDVIFNTVQFLDADHGFVTGEYGVVLATGDGGATWEERTPAPEEFYVLTAHFSDPSRGWLAGPKGLIYTTSDGARSWRLEPTESDATILRIIVAANGDLYAVGSGGVAARRESDCCWSVWRVDPMIRSFLRAGLVMDDGTLLVAGGQGAFKIVPLENADRDAGLGGLNSAPAGGR